MGAPPFQGGGLIRALPPLDTDALYLLAAQQFTPRASHPGQSR